MYYIHNISHFMVFCQVERVNSFKNVTEAVAIDFSFFGSFFLFVNRVDMVDKPPLKITKFEGTFLSNRFADNRRWGWTARGSGGERSGA